MFNQKVKLYLANRAVLLMLNKNSQKKMRMRVAHAHVVVIVVMRWQHMRACGAFLNFARSPRLTINDLLVVCFKLIAFSQIEIHENIQNMTVKYNCVLYANCTGDSA